MTYNDLKSITKQAVCHTLGAASKDFDKWLVTCDPNDGIEIEGYDFGTCVELSFDPSVSPFNYFSSEVVFYVSTDDLGMGNVQAFFGSSCYDVDSAEEVANDFLDRGSEDGWFVEEYFDEDSGLHLMREFEFDPKDPSDLSDKLISCFSELCGPFISSKLRSFIHYFED
ncbi:MAG: hypothetical protein E7653_06730 [Ruminococcaceae bacterium]|nr:hypothetical protein [Oscillospiraceae bacterium]